MLRPPHAQHKNNLKRQPKPTRPRDVQAKQTSQNTLAIQGQRQKEPGFAKHFRIRARPDDENTSHHPIRPHHLPSGQRVRTTASRMCEEARAVQGQRPEPSGTCPAVEASRRHDPWPDGRQGRLGGQSHAEPCARACPARVSDAARQGAKTLTGPPGSRRKIPQRGGLGRARAPSTIAPKERRLGARRPPRSDGAEGAVARRATKRRVEE